MFFPPYSPFLNPIENCFSVFKSSLKVGAERLGGVLGRSPSFSYLFCIASVRRVYLFLFIMSQEDGKINGKFPIFDDLLAFMWCKLNVCPCDTLLNAVKSFYKVCDITKAGDTFDRRVPDDTGRRVKRRKTEDMLKQIYELMQSIPTEDPPVLRRFTRLPVSLGTRLSKMSLALVISLTL